MYKYQTYLDFAQRIQPSEEPIEEDVVCPVCCDTFQPETEVVVLSCNLKHIYHEGCISAWLSRHTLCPMCKTRVFA